jgi:tRNA(adenine34) deaminase
MTDREAMQEALEEARLAAESGEVPIGAVVIHEDRIIARGQNRVLRDLDPTAHAEIVALRTAATYLGNYRLINCTLYATLEPCAMCAGAMIHAVLAVLNHPRINHQMQVEQGILANESSQLLRGFFRERR